MPSQDEIRDAQRQGWNQSAPAWKKWATEVLGWSGPVGQVLLDRARLRDGSRVLDVATGLGEPAVTAAQRVGSGRVVGSDLSEKMLGVAAERGRERGLSNFETRIADATELPFPDGSFDAVLCQFGVMFFPDPARGVREMARVTVPGGRVALCAWGPPPANPWVATVAGPVNKILDLPPPPPDGPGMFRFAEPGSLAGLLEQAGLHAVVEEPVNLTQEHDSAERYWTMIREVAGGIARALEAASAEQRAAVDRAVLDALQTQQQDGRFVARGRAWVASGTR